MNAIVIPQRRKCKFEVELNGIVYNLGVTMQGYARRKAHHMVRNFILNQWREKFKNVEVTAYLKADGQEFGSIYGIHRNRDVKIIHL